MNTLFSDLGLHPQLVQTVADLGYEIPTPIQSQVIPALLAGGDVLGQAQTGTGKTASFALPLLHHIALNREATPNDPQPTAPQALIITPTRELALQVTQAIFGYGKDLGVRALSVYGGQPYGRQISRLQKGVDVVVGTPGRLLDLLNKGALDLSHLRILVLDEADEMLSMGFIEDIETILAATPSQRQTALFSATLPAPIANLARRYMNQPQSIAIQRTQLTSSELEERYYLVNPQDKLAALTRLFETEDLRSALIFVRTRADSGVLAGELNARGYAAEMINGDLTQEAREQVMSRFRRGLVEVLVATDVAARGLDINDISHVFNYDLPLDPESYVHRVGRTGRAGRTGIAISLITPKEQWLLKRIEGYTKQPITQTELPTEEAILALRQTRLVERLKVWLNRDRCNQEKEIAAQLVEEGYDLLDVAGAALKLARSEEKQRPIEAITPVLLHTAKGKHRREKLGREKLNRGPINRQQSEGRGKMDVRFATESHEQGMVRMLLDAGKEHGLRPSDVVGAIAYHADIPGKSIGAIHIRGQHTLVDIPERFAQQVLDKGGYKVRQHAFTVTRA
jgi:ATP-dependent RNA helicase DeaD